MDTSTPFHLDGRSAAGLAIVIVVGTLANSAGVGGGAIFIPLFQALLQFSVKDSTSLSQALITAGALVSVALNLFQANPLASNRCIIDFRLALLLAPVLLVGVSLGVLFNVLLPEWVLSMLLVLLMSLLVTQSLKKGIAMWRKETKARRRAEATNMIKHMEPDALVSLDCMEGADGAALTASGQQQASPGGAAAGTAQLRQGSSATAKPAAAAAAPSWDSLEGVPQLDYYSSDSDTSTDSEHASQQEALLSGSSSCLLQPHSSVSRTSAGRPPLPPVPELPARLLAVAAGDDAAGAVQQTSWLRRRSRWRSRLMHAFNEYGHMPATAGDRPLVAGDGSTARLRRSLSEYSRSTAVVALIPPSPFPSRGCRRPSGWHNERTDSQLLNMLVKEDHGLDSAELPADQQQASGALGGMWAESPSDNTWGQPAMDAVYSATAGAAANGDEDVTSDNDNLHTEAKFMLRAVSVHANGSHVPAKDCQTATARAGVLGSICSFRTAGDWIAWSEVAMLAAVWVSFLGMQLGKALSRQCSAPYWALFVLELVVMPAVSGGLSWYFARQARLQRQQREDVEDHADGALQPRPAPVGGLPASTTSRVLVYQGISFLAGLIGGLLGLGGGMVIGPLFIEIGIHPQVTAATSSLMVLFSSSTALIQFLLMKRVNIQYALVFSAASMIASVIGVRLVSRLVRRTGRTSIVVFSLATIMGIGLVAVGAFGIITTIHNFKEGNIRGHGMCE